MEPLIPPKSGLSVPCLRRLLLFVFLIVAAGSAGATIRYVKPGASGGGTSWADAGDLNSMITASVSGDQLWAARGTYLAPKNSHFDLSKGVYLYGGFAGTETAISQRDLTNTANASTLKANGSYPVYDSGTPPAILDGFTMTGGGPGALFNTQGSITISNCIFTNNITSTNGGAIINGGNMTITNCSFIGNTAGGYGGAICNSGGNTSITNCSFIGNTSGGYGGALYSSSPTGSTLSNCTFIGNAASEGEAIFLEASRVPTSITNCVFSGQPAGHTIYDASVNNDVITNCLMVGNGGAAIDAVGSKMTLTNCTISGNRGSAALSSSTFLVRNTIIYNNASGISNTSSTVTANNSLIQGMTATTNGNISGNTDPLFVYPLAPAKNTGGDYRLQQCSPVLTMGSNSYFASGASPDLSALTTDLIGNSRFYNGTIDMGAYESSGNPAPPEQLAINGDQAALTVSGNTTVSTNCRLIAALTPGTLSGSLNAQVWVDATQPADYVQRHYQLTPVNNAATATARVTLYFTQAEFDAYNAVNTAQLPTSSSDAAHISSLYIEQHHGTSSDGTGSLASYSSPAIIIKPADNAIVWDSTYFRWEVSFDISGFSGFFVKASLTPLPLRLLSFTGTRQNGYNQLQWKTADESNTKNFVLERSTDGGAYSPIATIAAVGSGGNAYHYADYSAPSSGKLLYRLTMTDLDGHYTYSNVIALSGNGNGNSPIRIYPNPVSDVLYISSPFNNPVGLYDTNGRLLQTITIVGTPQALAVRHLAAGLYFLRFADGSMEKFIKR